MNRLGFIVSMLLAATYPVAVQAQNTPFVIDNQPNYFALAVGVAPDYVGSNDYKFVVGPAGRIGFSNHRYVELVATQLTANLINHDYLRLGPTVNYRVGRTDVEDSAVDRMTDIDGAFEIGLAGGIELSNGKNPRYRFRVNGDILYDVSGEHEGVVATLATRYWTPLSKAFDLGIGFGATFASDDFNSTYFGVSATDAGLSGLSTYSAGGGMNDVNGLVALVMHLSPKWHVAAGLKYQKLVSDAADSPVVDDRGSDNQFIAGIGLAYAWR